jgi:hypothetical protein
LASRLRVRPYAKYTAMPIKFQIRKRYSVEFGRLAMS